MVLDEEGERVRKEEEPNPPVGQLVLFVCLHSTAVAQEEGQRVFWQRQHTTCHPRIKEVNHVEPKVPLEPRNVPVCSVHHLTSHD